MTASSARSGWAGLRNVDAGTLMPQQEPGKGLLGRGHLSEASEVRVYLGLDRSGCPQLHRPAATGRRRRSLTSTRSISASRRTCHRCHLATLIGWTAYPWSKRLITPRERICSSRPTGMRSGGRPVRARRSVVCAAFPLKTAMTDTLVTTRSPRRPEASPWLRVPPQGSGGCPGRRARGRSGPHSGRPLLASPGHVSRTR